MTLDAYLLGTMRAAAIAVPAAVAGFWLRTILISNVRGAVALLSDVVAAFACLLLVAHIVGVAGLLTFVPLFAGCISIAGGTFLVREAITRRRRQAATVSKGVPDRQGDRLELALAIAVTALVAGLSSARVARSLTIGITDIDSLRYHLPLAAKFVQSRSVLGPHFLELDHVATFSPSDTELFYSLTVIPFRRDLAVPMASLVWPGIALLSAWCIGRRGDLANLALAAGAIVLLLPLSMIAGPGSAKDDMPSIAMLMASAALLANRRAGPGMDVLAMIAAGLAASMKLTVLAPVCVFVLFVCVANRRAKRTILAALGAFVLTGAFWYTRNAAMTGSPVPSANLSIGSISLYKSPDPVLDRYGLRIVDYVRDTGFWRKVPMDLDLALGPGWLLVLAAGVGGTAVSIARGKGVPRWLGVAAAAGGIVYLVTPYSAGGPRGNPWLFPIDIRFAFGSLALGLALFAEAVGTSRSGRRAAGLIVAAAVLLTMFARPWRTWPPGFGRLTLTVMGGFAVAVYLGRLVRSAASRSTGTAAMRVRAGLLVGVAAAIAALVAIGYPIQRNFFQHRYRTGSVTYPKLSAWASHISGARMGIVGVTYQYPLFGPKLDNDVDYLGERVGRGGFRSLRTCKALIEVIEKGRYDYVVAGEFKSGLENAPERAWLTSNPAFLPVFTERDVAVFRLRREPEIASCNNSNARLETTTTTS